MLEAYEAYGDYQVHMDLTERLVEHLATTLLGTTEVAYGDRELSLATPWRRATLSELTSEAVGEEVSVDTPVGRLRELCAAHDVPTKAHYGPGKLLLELYEKTVEPNLWEPIFVTDYPKEVSPLSRDHRDHPGLVERFEGIVAGRELCNGFSELVDPDEQRRRFEDQVVQRDAGDDEAMAVDEDYLRALEYGLPPTVGLGIGIDRLVMLLTDTTTIRDVIFFPTLRPEQPHD
jgi:lysyl-tRNA synthetase class 2